MRSIKCFISAAAVVFALMLLSTPLAAKEKTTIQDMLKSQQEEIENLKKEIGELKVSKDTSGTSGYDHGFFIKSKDDLYSFKSYS